jgi:hypothetical protein
MSDLAGLRALVTGASSGIGAAIAHELAARGVHLVLSARRRDALDAVAGELKAAYRVRCDVVPADLGTAAGAGLLWMTASATGAIDILVNNAGFGYFRAFAEVERARDAELVQLNIASVVELTRLFVDAHARAGKSGRGYILNVGSIGAYQSVPNMALYAASKAFVRNFTEGLHDELRGTPLSATCLSPGGTRTAFHAAAGAGDYSWIANASMMSAERVARIGVVAMARGKRNAIPGLMNKLSCWGVRFVPRAVASWLARRVLGKPRLELPARRSA